MSKTVSIIFLFLTLLGTGCIGPGVSPMDTTVEVYRDGEKPTRAYKSIGLLTDEGSLGEQGEIEQQMRRKARAMGGQALILDPLRKVGEELRGFGLVETYLYRANVIKFD